MKLRIFFDAKIRRNDYPEFDLVKLRKILEKVTKEEKMRRFISLIFTNNFKIKQLNKEYRGKNEPTDVLSFNYREEDQGFIDQLKEQGEVYVSLEFLLDYSRRKGLSFDYLVYRVVLHGVLHLAGYNHQTIKDYQAMIKKEQYFIEEI